MIALTSIIVYNIEYNSLTINGGASGVETIHKQGLSSIIAPSSFPLSIMNITYVCYVPVLDRFATPIIPKVWTSTL